MIHNLLILYENYDFTAVTWRTQSPTGVPSLVCICRLTDSPAWQQQQLTIPWQHCHIALQSLCALQLGRALELASIWHFKAGDGLCFISACFHDSYEAKRHWWEKRRLQKMEERGYGREGWIGNAKTHDSLWRGTERGNEWGRRRTQGGYWWKDFWHDILSCSLVKTWSYCTHLHKLSQVSAVNLGTCLERTTMHHNCLAEKRAHHLNRC